MDLPVWADVLLILIAVWIVVVIVLVIVGRVLLARELALVLPNLVRLFGGLMRDPRVGIPTKIAVGVGSLWLASPIDLVPDFIPIVGALDDAIVAALVLRFVLNSTDGAVVLEHWHGDPATLARLLRLASLGSRGTPRALR